MESADAVRVIQDTSRLNLDTVGSPDSHGDMKSRVADGTRRRLAEHVARMTAEERLAAFLEHCQLIAQIAGNGGRARQRRRGSVSGNAR